MTIYARKHIIDFIYILGGQYKHVQPLLPSHSNITFPTLVDYLCRDSMIFLVIIVARIVVQSSFFKAGKILLFAYYTREILYRNNNFPWSVRLTARVVTNLLRLSLADHTNFWLVARRWHGGCIMHMYG